MTHTRLTNSLVFGGNNQPKPAKVVCPRNSAHALPCLGALGASTASFEKWPHSGNFERGRRSTFRSCVVGSIAHLRRHSVTYPSGSSWSPLGPTCTPYLIARSSLEKEEQTQNIATRPRLRGRIGAKVSALFVQEFEEVRLTARRSANCNQFR